jgi:hypothetical protein
MFYSNEDGKFQFNPSVYHLYNPWALKKVSIYFHLETKMARTLFQDWFWSELF